MINARRSIPTVPDSATVRLGIMQPYFLPYLGYWQLMAAVDRFVVYDDVQYIKGGWVNRNRIKQDGAPTYISLHLLVASPNKRICEIELAADSRWKRKILKNIEQAYARAPFSGETLKMTREVVLCPETDLSAYLLNGLMRVKENLGIDTPVVPTSRRYVNADLHGAARVIDICRREDATDYVNAEGGRHLYLSADFAAAGIRLSYLTMRPFEYAQGPTPFVSHLSVLDPGKL